MTSATNFRATSATALWNLTRRLDASAGTYFFGSSLPRVKAETDAATGNVWLSWPKIPGATRVRLSIDEGNKFNHSRMLKILDPAPGQHVGRYPEFRWIGMIEHVNSFDVALFNKARSYWVFLRGVRNTNAMATHPLEPGQWFAFVKASRDLGQTWSFPVQFSVDDTPEPAEERDVVVTPRYMDSEGEYFTPDRLNAETLTGNQGAIPPENWLFLPRLIGHATRSPLVTWPGIPGASHYVLYFHPTRWKRRAYRYTGPNAGPFTVPDRIRPGLYRVFVHAVTADENGKVRRLVRSAVNRLRIERQPETAAHIAMERERLRKLEADSAFTKHSDAIEADPDQYTGDVWLSWPKISGATRFWLDLEDPATGRMWRYESPANPLNASALLPEGYFDARLVVTRGGKNRMGPTSRISTLRDDYFEDLNPRPAHTLALEDLATGRIWRCESPANPLNASALLPEGYFDARLVVARGGKNRMGPVSRISTMRDNYFEDRNPRPAHILSMDEGNKFNHSRMLKILDPAPGQHVGRYPVFRWIGMIEHVNSFDVALFNKARSYWVFLRGVRNTNATAAHPLEPGDWFAFVKASRDLGQIWSFPVRFTVDDTPEPAEERDVVVTPRYMDSEGEYFTPDRLDGAILTGNRGAIPPENWLFLPRLIGPATRSPSVTWPGIPGASHYDLYFHPTRRKRRAYRYTRPDASPFTVPDKIRPGLYQVFVHAVTADEVGKVRRIVRSAVNPQRIERQPEKAAHIAMERERLRKLEANSAFEEHLDAIAGMDLYTNVKLKRWEVENGVAKLLSMPYKITALVGYNCNIDCHFCDNGRVPRDIAIPSRFIDDLKFLMPYARVMQVLGGEPLMLKDFRRIVDMAKDHPHLNVSTTTNGTLVDDEWASYFARGNFSQIWMSVDGATEPVYQSMRRGGELKPVVDGVKKIIAYGEDAPVVCWSFIVSRRNYHEIVDYYRLARDIGVKSIYYKMLQLRFGPNYPGVGRLDALMDREICAKVVEDLATVRDMARRDGIEFDERVVSYVRHVHPDLATGFLDRRWAVDAEAEGGEDLPVPKTLKPLPPPPAGDPAEQQRILDRLIGLHRSLGNDRHRGIRLTRNQETEDELCQLPFTHLGLNGTNAYMCCYATSNVLPIKFEPDQEHLTEVWNSERYLYSREAFFRRAVDDSCLGTCPYRKEDGRLWRTGQLQYTDPTYGRGS